MKKVIKIAVIIFVLVFILFLSVSCDQSKENQNAEYCTVSYITYCNLSIPDVQIEKGQSIQEPFELQKSGYVFVAWYLENTFLTEISFPYMIEQSITLYAKWITEIEATEILLAEHISLYGTEIDSVYTIFYPYQDSYGNGVRNISYNWDNRKITIEEFYTAPFPLSCTVICKYEFTYGSFPTGKGHFEFSATPSSSFKTDFTLSQESMSLIYSVTLDSDEKELVSENFTSLYKKVGTEIEKAIGYGLI